MPSIASIGQTPLEKDVTLFETKKFDESYKFGRLLTTTEKKQTLATVFHDGELLHYGTHQSNLTSLDISNVRQDGGHIKEISRMKLINHNTYIVPSAMDTDRDHFYIGDDHGRVSLFARLSGQCIATDHDHSETVSAIKKVDNQLYHTGHDGYFLVQDLEYNRIVHSWIATQCPLSSMIVKNNNQDSENSVLVGSWDGSISQIDLRAKSCMRIENKNSPIRTMCLHEDGNILVGAHGLGHIRSWDLRKIGAVDGSSKLFDYGLAKGHSDAINCMVMVQDKFYTGSDDQTVRMFDINKRKCLDRLQGHNTGVMNLCVSNGLLVASNYTSFRKYRLRDLGFALAHSEEMEQRKAGEEEAAAKAKVDADDRKKKKKGKTKKSKSPKRKGGKKK
mmetsp:Transcript_15678/g.28139  ORF Transcript_15678/g.28139 Transcript_15678/m.28139 type:complete len:390 (-) Transcript_15678:129-1298(-)|eukprot:CAMPEP_0197528770 /NCGR_PEP_ID=MMETSP1318-20131121/26224_1 /TAXON_ID=552666 /ORGANISM="Partenskyella glossopodia, Strain RCC365" /LENGTH=389 /DNA_ID=CAMNT_0043083991 /DNA_START=185 /DNA_END=1354 /DNA_ORIENTATION=-